MEMIFGLLSRWVRALFAFLYSPKGHVARLPYSLWFVTYSIIGIAVLSVFVLFLIAAGISFFACAMIGMCNPFEPISELLTWFDVPRVDVSSQTVIFGLCFISVLLPSIVLVPLKRLRSMGFSAWWLALWWTPILGIIFGLLLCFWRPMNPANFPKDRALSVRR